MEGKNGKIMDARPPKRTRWWAAETDGQNWAKVPQETIDRCLTCPYPTCVNCLSGNTVDRAMRKREILRLIDQGYSNQKIAERVGCSVRNVRYYRNREK